MLCVSVPQILVAHLAGCRLTLASGLTVYNPQPATPSSTNTSTEVITFAAAHGWATGTMIWVNTTAGGLTANTLYYVNALSATTISLYTTLANALADTSRVNLTASITAELRPIGIQQKTLSLESHAHSWIGLYDGAAWTPYKLTSAVTASPSLTANTLYYVYFYLNGSTPTIDCSTTAPTTQDGVRVKTGATSRRLVGWVYALATDTMEDSCGSGQFAGNRLVVNCDNQVELPFHACPGYADDDSSTTYTVSATSWASLNGGTGSKVQMISDGRHPVDVTGHFIMESGASAQIAGGIGIDSTTAAYSQVLSATGSSLRISSSLRVAKTMTLGLHYVEMLGYRLNANGTGRADVNRHGDAADPYATYLTGHVMG